MDEKSYFPLFVDISKAHFIIIGAGEVAKRRIETLSKFICHITVIAPEVSEGIVADIIIRKMYSESDLEGADYVLATTNDIKVNKKIVDDAKSRNIPVNDASNKDNCDFFFPGIVKKNSVVIGICASGLDHRLAKNVTETIRQDIEGDKDVIKTKKATC